MNLKIKLLLTSLLTILSLCLSLEVIANKPVHEFPQECED
jgi:hypothetical protein